MPRLPRIAAALLLALPALAMAQAKPQAEFKLEPYRKTIALRASVNGVPGLFPFDTAGGSTHVSPDYAKRIGCTPWGRLTGYQMHGQRLDTPRCDKLAFKIDATTFPLPVAGVLDVTALYPEGAAPVDGLIALDLFEGKTITIDFPGKRLIVESPESLRERTRDAREVPVRLEREMQGRSLGVSIESPTPKGPILFELDSGNGGTLLVAKEYAQVYGLDPAKHDPQQGDFEVLPGLRAKGMTFAAGITLDGNLGMPFLHDKVVTIDLAAGRMWIAYQR